MSFIMRPIRFASTGHIIEGSGLFDGSSGFLSRTPGTAGNKQTFTISAIVKRSALTLGGSLHQTVISTASANNQIRFNTSTDKLEIIQSSVVLATTQVFRDPAAWLHIVLAVDTTQATAANRYKLYVNGTQITDYSTASYPSQNTNTGFNNTEAHHIGRSAADGNRYLNGYGSQVIMIDGQALAPTDFGEVTDDGFWQINDASGLTFGDNGFLLTGGSAMAAGTDSSGNDNDFTKSGTITATNDSPTNDADNDYGNYCTWDPLVAPRSGVIQSTFSGGNLVAAVTTSGQWIEPVGNLIASDIDKSVYELTVTNIGGNVVFFGFASTDFHSGSGVRVYWLSNGTVAYVGGSHSSSDTYTTGDVLRAELDMTTGEIQFYKNGTLASDASSPTFNMDTTIQGDGWVAYVATFASGTLTANFGATAFSNTPTSGFLPIATQNLPEPDVINYEDEYYIEAGISHSNGSTTAVTLPKTVSGGAMARIKRTNTTGDWYIFDTVRGANKSRKWNEAEAEDTTTFDDQNLTGTTLTLPSDLASGTYLVEVFYVGSYFQIQTVTGNAGARTITWPTAMDSYGFSAFFPRTGASSGISHHIGIGAQQILFLDGAGASNNRTNFSQAPNKTDFRTPASVGPDFNLNTIPYVCYGWANSGPYAFGSYTGNGGNGNAGPFINVGGAPRSLFAKKTTSSTIGWIHHAGAYNDPVNANETDWYCAMNTTGAIGESTGTSGGVGGDFVSTGWKHRGGFTDMNASGVEIIYGAFGIQPLTDGAINQGRAGAVPPYDQAYGGNTIKRVGNFWVHTFTSSGTFTPHEAMDVEYLIIGGGGGGGFNIAGGGGAGGYRTATGSSVSAQDYAITVGAGGAGSGTNNTVGANGGGSVFNSITSLGGGGGGSGINNVGTKNGVAGGSGGGGNGDNGGAGGSSSANGNNGGNGVGASSPNYGAGGGGGSGAVGANGTNTAGGAGGAGTSSSIDGTATVRAGGGGGGSMGGTAGVAGSGGAGAGTNSNTTAAAATANTGSGGGGGGRTSGSSGATGGAGGSGIVIIKYAIG